LAALARVLARLLMYRASRIALTAGSRAMMSAWSMNRWAIMSAAGT
jgi:hypothetical protein